VLVLSEVEGRFGQGASARLEDGRLLTVEAARRHHSGLLVKFEEIADRTAAEPLRGMYLFIGEQDLPDLPAGSFWPHELEGLEVVTEGGRSLGAVREVVLGDANDIWVAVAEDGDETLVPALKDVVVSVDVPGRRVVVRDMPGLTAPEAD
jgi:16S rRNA processing protein RimM